MRPIQSLLFLSLLLAAFPVSLVLAQTAGPTEVVQQLALSGEDRTLTVQVEQWPDQAREAFQQLLRASVRDQRQALADDPLVAAQRLAETYAEVWTDEFLLRELGRFRSWPFAERELRIVADSLRLAGRDAYWEQGIDAALVLWQESLEISTEIGDSTGVARALGNIGVTWYAAGQLDSAAAYYRRAYDLAVSQGDFRTAANGLTNLASIRVDRSDLRSARELYGQAARMHERVGDHRGLAADRHNQGLISLQLHDYDGARRRFADALAINRRYSYLDGVGTNLLGLADISLETGASGEADSIVREADRAFREAQDEAGVAAAAHRYGIVKLRRGDYRRASASLLEAAEQYQRLGWPVEASEALRDASTASAAAGDLDRSSGLLRRAEALLEERSEYVSSAAELALARGDLALRFNDPAESSRQFGRAAALFAEAADEIGRAEALQGEGQARLASREYRTAADLLNRALQVQQAWRVASSPAYTRVLLAYAEEMAGDRESGQTRLILALDELTELGDSYGFVMTLLALGESELRVGAPSAANEYFRQGLEVEVGRSSPSLTWRLHAGRGEAYRMLGDPAQAAAEFDASVIQIERVARTVAMDSRRSSYLLDKWEVYAGLADAQLSQGRVAAAFETSERLRARQMLAMLDRGRIHSISGADTGLVEREQDLRQHIAALETGMGRRQLEHTSVRGSADEIDRSLQVQLDRAHTEYARLLDEIRERVPEFAELVNPSIATGMEVVAALQPDEAFLEYLVSDSTTLVFVLTPDSTAALDLGLPARPLSVLVDFARSEIDEATSTSLTGGTLGSLTSLYRQLIAPIEAAGLLDGIRRLTISPHGELHYLPFQSLREEGEAGGYLVERYDIRYVPSASVWRQLDSRAVSRASGQVLILAPDLERLPGAKREAVELGRRFGDGATLLVGSDASERALRELAGPYEVVHLATEGALNKANPLFSYLALASTGSDDGRLEVHEVAGLDLRAELVTLSACETALGSGAQADVPAGDDWLGFVRAFLFAGASNVLATLWRVDDLATADFMSEFYGLLAEGMRPAEALAITQRRILAEPSTRQPFYWAGFVLSGN